MKLLLQKVTDAMAENFIGNYVFLVEDLEKIYDFTSNFLRKYDKKWINKIPTEYDELVFVAMVNAIKEWNANEDTFWKHIYKKLIGTSASQKIYLYLTNVIERLGNNKKIIYLSGCTKRYYATILVHAFAPLNSTESFLELCWNLYSEDLNFTYNKNDEIFTLLAEELRHTFTKERSLEDDIALGSEVYSLKAGIKRMAIDSPEKMIQHIENTISLLDRVFSGEILDTEYYYNSIIRNWWIEKEKSFGISKPKKKVAERAITDYSTISPKYNYNGRQAVLTIPSIRLKNNFYDKPILNIYRNEELIDQRDIPTFGSGLIMATKEFNLYVDNLVSINGIVDCSIEIVHCDEVIYNSKKYLFRDYILFRDRREIMQEECLPGNYILFTPNFDSFSVYPDRIKKIPLEPNLYIMSVKDGEMLQSSKRTVFFAAEKQKRSIEIVVDRKNNAKFICNGEEYIVIDGDLKVKVNTDVDISKYGIRYETTNFRLKDFTCIEDEGYRTFLITELLNVCEPQKINIFTYDDNRIEASYNVVKFNSISITYDKKLYFDENNLGTVRFLTEKYDKSVTFDINQGDIIIPFDDAEIVLSPPVLKWKIGDSEFSMKYGKDLWYKNYSNTDELIIDIPMIGYQVLLSNNRFLTESNMLNSFKLGETIYSMLNEKKELVVFVKPENMEMIPILTICLKEKFNFSPFVINGKKFIWDSSKAFVGDNTAKFRISFYENDTVIHSFEIDEQITESYQSRSFSLSNLEMGFYNITLDLLKQVGFTKKAIRLFEHKVIYGDINKIRFKGKCLHFEKVMLTKNSSYEEIKPFYVDHLWYIGEFEDCHYYTGSVYVITHYGRKAYLNTMPNSEGTYDKINPIRLELKSERSCFIVAGVNFNDMYDFLGEFTLDTLNRISNFNKNTKGIDYFVFNIEECK